jgi:hypothetical protein
MPSRMWSLDAFRFDDSIPGSEVYVYDEDQRELVAMTKADALQRARSRDMALIAQWPTFPDEETVSCVIGKLALPVRWEQVSEGSSPEELDENLWFEATCGGRDILTGNGHTFAGRMRAWCPHTRVGYNVSLREMGDMSEQSRYFVRGFLCGTEPDSPTDTDGDTAPADLQAWLSATARFRRTGSWYGRWGTCDQCGCVLLPDSAADFCDEHQPPV